MSETTLYPRFVRAAFGDMFKTRNGIRAIYIGKTDPFIDDEDVMSTHEFYVELTGVKLYYNDGASVDGIAADDIIGRDNEVDESSDYFIQGWQQAEINDCLKKCRRYIAAVEKRNSRDGKRIAELLKMIDDTRKYVAI
jgi:hypothetical protein